MNEEVQRIAIAETCGWENKPRYDSGNSCWYKNGEFVATSFTHLPDYCNDLNAMHKAEKVLSHEQKLKYYHHICVVARRENGQSDHEYIYAPFSTTHATAAQRAEAFLQTLDLWK